MIAVDVSLLAYAVNRHAPEHPRAAAVVDLLVHGERAWALPWPVVHEFLELVTHPHAAPRPLGALDAMGYITSLLESPSVEPIGPTPRHAAACAELLQAAGGSRAGAGGPGRPPRGLAVAAVLREHGVRELLSADVSMRRFGFLTVVDPLHGEPWKPGGPPARRYRRLERSR